MLISINKIKRKKMKKLTFTLIAILMVALTACSNPISSEFDGQDTNNEHTPLYSGHSENG